MSTNQENENNGENVTNAQRIYDLMIEINEEVMKERIQQNNKWGNQRHEHGRWLAILIEEVGEAAEAMQVGTLSSKPTDASNLYDELIQVAAVASAWAEQEKERLRINRNN